jgi:hypothetical protein
MLVYFWDICNILRPLGIFYVRLVIYVQGVPKTLSDLKIGCHQETKFNVKHTSFMTRVTRLDEFSPNGSRFTSGSFFVNYRSSSHFWATRAMH